MSDAKSAPSWRHDKRKTAERGYGGAWQKARAAYLKAHPLCVMCAAERPVRVTVATVVDHRVPHRGDRGLFWDRENWQSLCVSHHNGDKQSLERTGNTSQRVGLDGFPVSMATDEPPC